MVAGAGRVEEGAGRLDWHHRHQNVEGRGRRRIEVNRTIGVVWRGGTTGFIGWCQIERLP